VGVCNGETTVKLLIQAGSQIEAGSRLGATWYVLYISGLDTSSLRGLLF